MESISYWQEKEGQDAETRRVNEGLARSAMADAGDDAEGPRVGGDTAAALAVGPSAYLEQSSNTPATGVEQWNEIRRTRKVKIAACGCRSWFCVECCQIMGYRLRVDLIEAVQRLGWTHPMMLTFTLDPEVFGDPRKGFDYCRRPKKNAISRTVERLFRRGFLLSRHYCWVIELQDNGWPHWHVLVDASFIPFDELAAAWNENLDGEDGYPTWQERVALGRPGLGSVKFSKRDFRSVDHAIMYVTKYLVKPPKHPWPEWVKGMSGRALRRYDHSKGFFAAGCNAETPEWVNETPERAEPVDVASDGDEAAEKEHRKPARTIGQMLDECGTATIVVDLEQVEEVEATTGEVRVRVVGRRFLGKIEASIGEVLNRAHLAGLGNLATLGGAIRPWIELDSDRAGEFLAAVSGPGVAEDEAD